MNGAKIWAVAALSVLLAACGGGGCNTAVGSMANCGNDDYKLGQKVDQPPVADAGAIPNVVLVGRDVFLNGLNSKDPEGQPLSFSWSITSQPVSDGVAPVTLTGSGTAKPSFKPTLPGNYAIELKVYDGVQYSSPSTVVVTAAISNVPPVAVAKADTYSVTVPRSLNMVQPTVHLDGSDSKPGNGFSLTYRWEIKQSPTGSSALLVGPTAAKPTFAPDKVGTYRIGLVVNDGLLDSDVSVVTIFARDTNVEPVANAGKDVTAAPEAYVVLDGTGSTDPNGDELTYTWNLVGQPFGSTAKLYSTTAPKPAFVAKDVGVYVISLIVTDKEYLSSKESFVSVTVK